MFKQKTAYELRISDWSSDVCSSDLKHRSDRNVRHDEDLECLVERLQLLAELEIPDAASKLCLLADLSRRTITAEMNVEPPQDKKLGTACVTWLLNQLRDCKDDSILKIGRTSCRESVGKEE